jgi:hypothetical protein
MNRKTGKVQCSGCGASGDIVVYDVPIQDKNVAKNTPWLRPPRGWFMSSVFLNDDGQVRFSNALVCASCMALGRVQRNAIIHEEKDPGQGSGERLPDEVLPSETAEDA